MIEIHLLGWVSATRNDQEIRISPTGRRLLAALAIEPAKRVSRSRLEECLRDGGQGSPNILDGHISKLRGALRGLLLRSEPGYYRLEIEPETVDYWRFQEGVRRATKLDDPRERGLLLHETLGLWRDDRPLDGVSEEPFRRERAEMLRQQSEVRLLLAEAWIAIGDYRTAAVPLDQLHTLGASDPDFLQEYVKVLFALGRHEDLAHLIEHANSAMRQTLKEQHQALQNDSRTFPAPRGMPIPRQLPATSRYLLGREAELAFLDDVITTSNPGPRVVVIHGTGGVGKTSLGTYWSHRIKQNFPDGSLYADLHGHSSEDPQPIGQVLAHFVRALGGDSDQTHTDAMPGIYQSLLSDKAVLVLLDNVRNSEQVRELIPADRACVTLITSRNRLDHLESQVGAKLLRVDPLDRAGQMALLELAAGEGRIRADPESAERIAELAAGLPLALWIIGARIKNSESLSLNSLRKRLEDETSRLDAFSHPDHPDIRAVLFLSYDQLSNEAKHVFRLLGCYPTGSFELGLVCHIAGLSPARGVLLLEELTSAHLLVDEGQLFTFHELLRAYSVGLSHDLTAEEVSRTHARIADYLLHSAYVCDQMLGSGRFLPVPPWPGLPGILPTPTSSKEALAWLKAAHDAILATAQRSQDLGHGEHGWLLPLSLVTCQWRLGWWRQAETALLDALPLVREHGDRRTAATLHRMLANTRRNLSKYAQAELDLRQAIALSQQDGDALCEAHAQQLLGVTYETWAERAHLAGDQYSIALTLYRQVNDVRGQAHALNGLAYFHFLRGDHDQALVLAHDALYVVDPNLDANCAAAIQMTLGQLHLESGDAALSVEHFRTAVRGYRELGYPPNEGRALTGLTEALLADGRVIEARATANEADVIFARKGDTREIDLKRYRDVTHILAHLEDSPPENPPSEITTGDSR